MQCKCVRRLGTFGACGATQPRQKEVHATHLRGVARRHRLVLTPRRRVGRRGRAGGRAGGGRRGDAAGGARARASGPACAPPPCVRTWQTQVRRYPRGAAALPSLCVAHRLDERRPRRTSATCGPASSRAPAPRHPARRRRCCARTRPPHGAQTPRHPARRPRGCPTPAAATSRARPATGRRRPRPFPGRSKTRARCSTEQWHAGAAAGRAGSRTPLLDGYGRVKPRQPHVGTMGRRPTCRTGPALRAAVAPIVPSRWIVSYRAPGTPRPHPGEAGGLRDCGEGRGDEQCSHFPEPLGSLAHNLAVCLWRDDKRWHLRHYSADVIAWGLKQQPKRRGRAKTCEPSRVHCTVEVLSRERLRHTLKPRCRVLLLTWRCSGLCGRARRRTRRRQARTLRCTRRHA